MDRMPEEQASQKASKFQWFLFAFFIPILFAVTVALLVFTLSGNNVFETAKEYGQKVPLLSSIFNGESSNSEVMESQLIELEAEIKDREARITQLESQLDSKELEIERAGLEKQRLEQEIEELTAIKEENKRAFKDIVKTYESISAKKAAPILTEMKDEEAVKILSNVKADTLAAIMEKMDPEDAAHYTALLTAAKESNVQNN
ncbi:MotE family protein [Bacillus sp. ISL-47]|uniref:MotE family protein n=1 Tax=Bacillus sp. ISL-47 TaxID=2819130 RepID=UPI001BEB6376|nr:MotE family protein [Bacillus sp. ISL-47]MBT2688559.1 MotE family protein [Bacillus sp. ISL-47]MBT2708857.1 MotE family protein [Pseudomonas sp. ISL-84]